MAALAGAAAVVPGAALAAEATRPDLSDELRSARSVLPVNAGHLSPEIAARVQAWREAREIYFAADARDDANIDPLHDAKERAYDALLDEPVQTFGDLLAMVRTIKEEDDIGTEYSPYQGPAFDAVIAAVESLAVGG